MTGGGLSPVAGHPPPLDRPGEELWQLQKGGVGSASSPQSRARSGEVEEDVEEEAEAAMAGNELINGYLEAILDAGGGKGLESRRTQRTSLVPQLKFSPTKYFVEEVVNGFDEADLYKTWTKVTRLACLCDRPTDRSSPS